MREKDINTHKYLGSGYDNRRDQHETGKSYAPGEQQPEFQYNIECFLTNRIYHQENPENMEIRMLIKSNIYNEKNQA